MNEQQEQYLVEQAKAWMTRTHLGRTDDEKYAYLEAVQDALTAVYQDTRHGAYPAHYVAGLLEEIFEI
jgi:hypothetical protein